MAQVQVADVIAPVAQLCKNCPLPTLTLAYIDAARELCNKSRWFTATVNGATIAPVAGVGTSLYSLGSDANNEIFGISAIDLTRSDLTVHPITPKLSSDFNLNDDFGEPCWYQYIPHGEFVLHRVPDAAYPLSIGIVMQPKIGSNSVSDTLLVNWKKSLERGALAYLLDMKDEAWYNPTRANKEMVLFNADVAAATSDAQAGNNAGALATNRIGPRAATVRTKKLVI